MNQTNMYTKFYILRLLILSRSESVAGEAIPNVEYHGLRAWRKWETYTKTML